MKRPWAMVFLLVPGALWAQPVPSGDALEQRLRRGVELRRAGQDEAAFTEFEAAYGLRAEPRTAAQLALVCQATGRWVRAESMLREALAAPDDAWVARNRAALEGARAVAERHLATLEVVAGAGEEGLRARVRVNDEAVGVLPLAAPVRVVAGAVVLQVEAEGFVPWVRRFEIAPGERLRERVDLVRQRPPSVIDPEVRVPSAPVPPVPVVVPPVVVPPVVPPAAVGMPVAPWGALALGSFVGAGLALGVGVGALVVREQSVSGFNSDCEPGATAGDCGTLRDRAVFSEGVAVTALPVAVALSAAGTYLLVRRARQPRALGLACGGGVLAVQCAWRF
jgi:hypothetical protein